MNISIGNDHAGTDYKFAIIKHLESKGIIVTNYGTNTNDSVDYPDFVHPVASDVNDKKVELVDNVDNMDKKFLENLKRTDSLLDEINFFNWTEFSFIHRIKVKIYINYIYII